MNLQYSVLPEDAGKKVYQILKKNLSLSERLIKKLKGSHSIFLNSSPVFVNVLVSTGDIVAVRIDFIEEYDHIQPENIPLEILYEDEGLVAVNKSPFIVVHPTFNHPSGTVANGLLYHFNSLGITKKIRPVSRLDRDTSGIILFAKNQYVQEALIGQMKDKSFIKEYVGVVHGNVTPSSGTIDLPIARHPESIMLRHVSPTGRPAITHYEVIQPLKKATFLRFRLETGRTHQIRVHCQAIGHPLMGETLYPALEMVNPSEAYPINRQALHSYKVIFTHPLSKKIVELHAPIPQDMEFLLQHLK